MENQPTLYHDLGRRKALERDGFLSNDFDHATVGESIFALIEQD